MTTNLFVGIFLQLSTHSSDATLLVQAIKVSQRLRTRASAVAPSPGEMMRGVFMTVNLFVVVFLPLNTHSSDATLMVQATEVSQRLRTRALAVALSRSDFMRAVVMTKNLLVVTFLPLNSHSSDTTTEALGSSESGFLPF